MDPRQFAHILSCRSSIFFFEIKVATIIVAVDSRMVIVAIVVIIAAIVVIIVFIIYFVFRNFLIGSRVYFSCIREILFFYYLFIIY